MSQKIEGTLVLDGLIEGRLPDLPDAVPLLREWVGSAASLKLQFHLEIDGNGFNILADNTPVQAEDLGPDPAKTIAGALQELLEAFPAEQQGHILSTLRSVECRRGMEVQTLYAVGANGRIETRQRTVDAATAPPPRELTRTDKLRLAGIGVVVALLVFLVSSIFVDYRAIVERIFEQITPFDPDKLAVETGSFADYLIVTKKASAEGGKQAVLTLKRQKAFPKNAADCERLLAGQDKSLSGRLTVEALARGYVRYEFFDKKNEFMGSGLLRVAGLREKETVELALPLPGGSHPTRLVFTY